MKSGKIINWEIRVGHSHDLQMRFLKIRKMFVADKSFRVYNGGQSRLGLERADILQKKEPFQTLLN